MGVDECLASWPKPLPWDVSDIRSHLYKLGERGSGYRTESGTVQDFQLLRKQCLNGGTLFEDPEFPCTPWTAWGSARPRFAAQWLRPEEISANPKFFVEGASRFDVKQGSLGDCWMVATAASLTLNKALFNQVVPSEQSFDDDYAGIFHFRIWKSNRWLDVVIDDRLPCTEDRKLMYMRSHHDDEFWSALLEKAYAKLHGSYGSLINGYSLEAMEGMTGGLAERVHIDDDTESLFRIMQKAYERSSLMIATIKSRRNPEERLESGLVAGHSYSVTSVRLVLDNVRLLRLRNPWGNDIEWNGPWSDKSPEWTGVAASEREAMGLTFEDDGEFWISVEDFVKEFHFLDICNLGPDALSKEDFFDDSKKKWEVSLFEGAWVVGATAGGSPNYIKTQDTFWANPQFLLTLERPVDDEEKSTAVVALMQKNRRRNVSDINRIFNFIGFAIYKVDEVDECPTPLDMTFFRSNSYVCQVPVHQLPRSDQSPQPRPRNLLHRSNNLLSTRRGRIPASNLYRNEEHCDRTRQEAFRHPTVHTQTNSLPFPLELCRSMVAAMDHSRNGKLDLKEFKILWAMVRTCKSVFDQNDKDGSGLLSVLELRQALQCAGRHRACAGYIVNGRVLQSLVLRYASKDRNMAFDDFVASTIKLRSLIELFKMKDRHNTGRAGFTMNEWLSSTIYC